MPDPHALLLFLSVALVILLIPGPAVLFIVARSIEEGRSAGISSIIGLSAGGMVHVLGAAVGLSAFLARGGLPFNIIKYLGAAYLVYLGFRTLRDPITKAVGRASTSPRSTRLLMDGFAVNVLNPKSALFLFAYLPQFVDPSRGSPVLQILFLGVLFHALAIITDLAYVLVASEARGLLLSSSRSQRHGRIASGSTYIGLGGFTALS